MAYKGISRNQRLSASIRRRKAERMEVTNTNCCGAGPHVSGEVRVMRTGGDSNLILCRECWNREIDYRIDRNDELGNFAQHGLPVWESSKVYDAGE